MQIAIYQIDADLLQGASPSMLRSFAQEMVPTVSVAAAVEENIFKLAYRFETQATGAQALDYAWQAAHDVSRPEVNMTFLSKQARDTDKSDLYVADNGRAWINQGTWFEPYEGPLPRHREAAINLVAAMMGDAR